MNAQQYKGYKIIKNGDRYYSIMKPSGEYLCDSKSLKESKQIITSEVNIAGF